MEEEKTMAKAALGPKSWRKTDKRLSAIGWRAICALVEGGGARMIWGHKAEHCLLFSQLSNSFL